MSGEITFESLNLLTTFMDEPRVFPGPDGDPYLSRWYLQGQRFDKFGKVVNPASFRSLIRDLTPFSTFLHKFHRSDADSELHSHPWAWAWVMVLAGGYVEERLVGDRIVTITRKPGSIFMFKHDDYHRVDLLGRESWSLFLAGPYAGPWFFRSKDTGKVTASGEFLARKRLKRGDLPRAPVPDRQIPTGPIAEDLDHAVVRACAEPTLVDALAWIALWENDRVVHQAMKRERGPNGQSWDTFFRLAFSKTMAKWYSRSESDF